VPQVRRLNLGLGLPFDVQAAPASAGGEVFAGYLFIISAILAGYAASAMMLEGAYHHHALAHGKNHHAVNFVPCAGEPGVIRGQ